MKPPVARSVPHALKLHQDVRQDDYYWLRERENPEVTQYLADENSYYDEVMAPLQPLAEGVFSEMKARLLEDEVDVPVEDGPYYYYRRTVAGRQYPIYARKRAASRADLGDAPEEVILDVNQEAGDGGFYSVTLLRISPDHTRLAYLDNRDGSDRYTMHVRDLPSATLLEDTIEQIFLAGSLEWDASGDYLFYVTVDASQRPYQLWRHRLGSPGQDVLLYQEDDVTFGLSLSKTQDGCYILASSHNKETDEVRYLDTSTPDSGLTVFWPRVTGVKYELEHAHQKFLVLTNRNAENFTLLRAPEGQPDDVSEVFPYAFERYLTGVYPFQDGLVLEGRQEGLTQIWRFRDGVLSRLDFDETLYLVGTGQNRSFHPHEVLVHYESPLTPARTYGLDLATGALSCLKETEVPGTYDPAQYVAERLWSDARDGVKIPLSVVYRRGALENGPAPLVLYGYGSYGASMEPHFDTTRIPLLDRGIVFVTAHIRGGAEMGRSWYTEGKLRKKRNTFTDFVDAARDLIRRGYTTPELLAARGRSAGGLLMGAVANLAPELFQVIVAGVPFVDVVTTMLDASIPLTSLEWDEWGNPLEPESYDYMKSYSPYDQVEAKDYPHMLALTGLNDPRVAYWEPAKWVARLRVMKTDNHTLLLKTHMGAGHGGSSGRYNRLHELAEEYAFILDKLGIHA